MRNRDCKNHLRCTKVEVSTPSHFWLIYILFDRDFDADHEYIFFNLPRASFDLKKFEKLRGSVFCQKCSVFFKISIAHL